MHPLCEQKQVVTLLNGSLAVNNCHKPRYHEDDSHYDADKKLEWTREP